MWNLKSRASESRIQVKESGIPPTIGNWNPDSNEKASGIQSLESGTHKVDLSWITLHGTRQQLWLVYLASKIWKQCYWGTTFVESSKKTGLQVQYFLIHAIDVTSVKVTRWSSVKSYSTGNVTNFSYECLTLVILILLLPAEVESNCIRTAKWVKWLQLHSVLSLLIPFTWHPLPDHPKGLKKKKKRSTFPFIFENPFYLILTVLFWKDLFTTCTNHNTPCLPSRILHNHCFHFL